MQAEGHVAALRDEDAAAQRHQPNAPEEHLDRDLNTYYYAA